MFKERREFFRFNVSVPVHIEKIVNHHSVLPTTQPLLMKGYSKLDQAEVNGEINRLLSDRQYVQNGGTKLFSDLDLKLEFMIYLMESVMSGQDPRDKDNYLQKMNQQKILTLPQGGNNSSFVKLLQAYYLRVEDITAELMDVIENSIQGRIFILKNQCYPNFDSEHYLPNLSVQAQEGNWLAKVSLLLTSKLNDYEDVYRVIKDVNQGLSNSDSWPIQNINLGGGGFALNLEHHYQVGDRVNALFQLNNQYVLGQATCINIDSESPRGGLSRFVFMFDEITPESEAHIVRYITSKELEARQGLCEGENFNLN